MKPFKKNFAMALLLLLILLTGGCEKKKGAIYMRVINKLDGNAEILVKDKEKEIPADGNYHEANGYVETKFKLMNVVWDSVINWNPSCILEQTWKANRSVDNYFGEFERVPEDRYYTLTLDYKIEYSEPIEYAWLKGWYNITFSYSDNSRLIYSLSE